LSRDPAAVVLARTARRDFADLVGKEGEIVMRKRHVAHALFQSVGRDGGDWLFIVGRDGGWVIMRNGNEVDLDTGKHSSIDAGIQKFISLTASVPMLHATRSRAYRSIELSIEDRQRQKLESTKEGSGRTH
jgi:hypothetical protein